MTVRRIYTPMDLGLAIIILCGWYMMFGVKQNPLDLPMIGPLSTGQELAIMFLGTCPFSLLARISVLFESTQMDSDHSRHARTFQNNEDVHRGGLG